MLCGCYHVASPWFWRLAQSLTQPSPIVVACVLRVHRPFHGLSLDQLYLAVCDKMERPRLRGAELQDYVDGAELRLLIEECWATDPQRRPALGSITDRLGRLLRTEAKGLAVEVAPAAAASATTTTTAPSAGLGK